MRKTIILLSLFTSIGCGTSHYVEGRVIGVYLDVPYAISQLDFIDAMEMEQSIKFPLTINITNGYKDDPGYGYSTVYTIHGIYEFPLEDIPCPPDFAIPVECWIVKWDQQ